MPFILSFFLFFISFETHALVVVSDFDDTIKITNAGNLPAATYNGFFKSKVYMGMPELLSEIRPYSEGLHIVSAAPSIIAPRIRALLLKHGIAYESFHYRLLKEWKNKIAFKTQVIEKVIESGEEVILIGDDVEKDPEIFSEIMARYPGKILAAYVHRIKNRSLPEGVIPYLTSFDLAVHEHLAGRLGISSVMKVFEKFQASPNMKRAFPGFSYCPKKREEFSWGANREMAELSNPLLERILSFCMLR